MRKKLKNWFARLREFLFKEVDIAGLVYFRVVFGSIMLWEIFRFFYYDKIYYHYVFPNFTFPFPGFEWLPVLSDEGFYVAFFILGVTSFFIMIGLYYRLSALIFFVLYTHLFLLLDKTLYNNHYYLISLISFWMIFMPAHRALSLDALIWRSYQRTIPFWPYFILIGQISIVYFFGGIAKLNSDWLMGYPMRIWLPREAHKFPIVGEYFDSWMGALFFSYSGLFFDLFIPFLFLWRKTRWAAFIFATAFHLTNSRLFNIGIFPWFMIAADMMYLPHNWPRVLLEKIKVGKYLPKPDLSWVKLQIWNYSALYKNIVAGVVSVYFIFQILFPLRHYLYPGDVNWTEEGHYFAWHMKLRGKDSHVEFHIHDKNDQIIENVNLQDYLTFDQIDEMGGEPDMILRFARHIAKEYKEKHNQDVMVKVFSSVSMNGREPQLLIDPDVDISKEKLYFPHSYWILQLENDLIVDKT